MSPEDRDAAHVWDMLDAATAALSCVAELAVEAATADEMRMSAFERKPEILGEAVASLDTHPRADGCAAPQMTRRWVSE
jgi:uncharacterized protein with HEPN domain